MLSSSQKVAPATSWSLVSADGALQVDDGWPAPHGRWTAPQPVSAINTEKPTFDDLGRDGHSASPAAKRGMTSLANNVTDSTVFSCDMPSQNGRWTMWFTPMLRSR